MDTDEHRLFNLDKITFNRHGPGMKQALEIPGRGPGFQGRGV